MRMLNQENFDLFDLTVVHNRDKNYRIENFGMLLINLSLRIQNKNERLFSIESSTFVHSSEIEYNSARS